MVLVWGCLILAGLVSAASPPAADKDGGEKNARCIHIESIELKGNEAFSTARLKLRMKSFHSSLLFGELNCFNEAWLRKDIDGIVTLYREKGFPDVEIRYYLFEDADLSQKIAIRNGKPDIDPTVHDLNILVEIREGLPYRLSFEGNSAFSERELQKKIDLISKGNVNDAALKKGKQLIRQAYLDAGFQDVTVDFDKREGGVSDQEKEDEAPAVWEVLYTIDEGDQVVVDTLTIKGNRHIDEKEILSAMLTRPKGMMERGGFNARVLKKDIEAVKLLYLSKGFLNAAISGKSIPVDGEDARDGESTPSMRSVAVEITIDEGIQTLVNDARIVGLSGIIPLETAMDQLTLVKGAPFREYMITSDENLLGMLISEKGYPHVKVTGEAVLSEKKELADVVYQVTPGPFTRFGDIRYVGNSRLKPSVIEKRLTLVSGEPFSLRQVLLSERKVRESSAIKDVRINAPGLTKMEAAPDLEVVIEEQLPYFVEAAIGYDTAQTFYLDTKIGDNNFLGREIDAWVGAKVSGIGYRLESGLAKPYFLGTPIYATCNLYAEDEEERNQDFGTRSFGGEVKFSRPLWIQGMTAAVNFKYENRQTYGDVSPEERERRNILITSGALGYDTRDTSVRPTRGMLSTATLDLFTGFDNDLDRFVKYKVDFRKYLSPMNHVVFALRARIGHIQPFGSEDTVAEDQLFFLGGTSDVRGFDENLLNYDLSGDPVGGRTSINATLEARIDLPANFELNCFLDSGRIDEIAADLEPPSAVDSSEFRSSVGVGLRYITPIGPVGILYGHKLNPEEGEDDGRIHLSVGYTF